MPYCSKCGAQVDDEALFCKHCGASLKTQSESAANDRNYDRTQTSDQAKRTTYSASRKEPFSFKGMLNEGEVLCRQVELNRKGYANYLLALALCVLCELIISVAFNEPGGGERTFSFLILAVPTVFFFLFLISFAYSYPVSRRRLAFTNRRVIGIIGVKLFDIPLDKVTDVSVAVRGFGNTFGYGTLKISSGSRTYRFWYVDQPQESRAELMRQIDLFEKGRR